MEKKYRIERTKKTVKAIGADGTDAMGVANTTIVWDDEEGIGLELPPYNYIVGSTEKGIIFNTEEARTHAKKVAKEIEEYVRKNNIK